MLDSGRQNPRITRLAVDAVRVLSMDAVQKANSGHPGAPMALSPLAYVLWTRHLRHNPSNPEWLDRDRFILSAGHASMLLYSLLHLTGYELSLDEIRKFRQWGSLTAGHPEAHLTPGVETTTGPLGQGVANSVGMALAERWLAARFNRQSHEVIDHRTYVVCSDGDLMEGISHEVAAFAGHQRLGKLIWLFDDNRITIDGSTDLSSSTVQGRRFEGYGWHVQQVDDGNDISAIDAALDAAKAESDRPSVIALRTTIGYGSPNKAGSESTHGAALGEDEVEATKRNLDYPSVTPFHVDEEALAHWRETSERGARLEEAWSERFRAYEAAHPEAAAELRASLSEQLPSGWADAIPNLDAPPKPLATRVFSGEVLQGLAAGVPNLVGGSADLAGSNKTIIAGADNVLPDTPAGRNIHFGVREHGMSGILNGMALHRGVRPYGATFLIFSDYMRPSIRLAALMRLPVTYVFTHDSIGLGEDGPTHQPVEQLASLRSVPGLLDLRPADGPETAEAWKAAMSYTDGPSFLALTRQSVATIDRGEAGPADGLRRGAYVLLEAGGGTPDVILIASGSEVGLAIRARELLESEGIPTRVVSMPSWFLFGRQPEAYRSEVLPPSIDVRLSVEAASPFGWERWTGGRGGSVGIGRFGASAPTEVLFEKFGFSAAAVAARARALSEAAQSGLPG